MNAILHQVEHTIKASFMSGALTWLDEACGEVDDTLAMWSIYGARRLAWEQAELLWKLESHGHGPGYSSILARTVAMASRGFFV